MPTLKITDKQMASYEAARLGDFRQAIAEHLRDEIGGVFASESNETLLAFIDKGIKRAQAYGATQNIAFGNFIVMMAKFGDDFDTNTAYPWAQETLKGKSSMDGDTRIESLAAQFAFFLSNSNNGQGEPTPPVGQNATGHTTGGAS